MSKIETSSDKNSCESDLLPTVISFCGILALVTFTLMTRWQWSVFMDDIAYRFWMPTAPSLWDSFLKEVRDYWHTGRFYPVKYFMNLVKWRTFPDSPPFFHWFNSLIVLVSSTFGALAILNSRQNKNRLLYLIFVIGVILAQRPLYDVVALNTIAEGWVILFFGLGLALWPRDVTKPFWGLGYRVCFALSALSKEPAVVALAAAALVQILNAAHEANNSKKRLFLINAAIDFVLFLVLTFFAWKAKNAGNYLEDYSLLSVEALKSFFIGLFKIGLGAIPLLLFLPKLKHYARDVWEHWGILSQIQILCLAFGLADLFLSAARNTAGYLLVPASFSLQIFASGLFLDLLPQLSLKLKKIFSMSFAICLLIAFLRFVRFSDAINGPNEALRDLALSAKPRMIIINHGEAVADAKLMVRLDKLPITLGTTEIIKPLDAASFDGDVFLLELSAYHGRIPNQTITSYESALGGWKSIIDRGTYRVFFGRKVFGP